MKQDPFSPRVNGAIRALIEAGARRCVNDLLALIALPTANPPGNEGGVARYLGTQAEAFGARVAYPEPKPDRPNVVAEWRFGKGPALLLTSHMDTVPAPPELLRGRIEGERLYGRGACDAKGSLAAMLAACRAVVDLAESGLPLAGRLVFAGVIDEESGGSGTDHLAAHDRFDFAIVGEPTELTVVRGHRGALRRRLVFHGRAAHSSEPARGRNAIYPAARFALGIEALNARLVASADPEYGAATAGLNVIAGGSKVNVVPDRCEAQVERRLRPGETVAQAEAEVRAILAEIEREQPDLRWECESLGGDKEPAVIAADDPLVQLLASAAKEVLGHRPPIGIYRAGTDMVFLSRRGVPTAIFGPGSIDQAHTVDEFVRVGELAQAAEVYARLACRLLWAG